MTQKNIETMDRIVEGIKAGKNLSEVLAHIYTKRNVAIPFNKIMFNVSVKDLNIPSKAYNALMRAKISTVNEVIEYNETTGLKMVKNFGIAMFKILMEAILDYSWDVMDEKEKVNFLIDTVERNEAYLRA
jgi:DNA-directed RNA polymerase alpha subunit